jgi:Mn-dependent DtxR family transcriptional regulator
MKTTQIIMEISGFFNNYKDVIRISKSWAYTKNISPATCYKQDMETESEIDLSPRKVAYVKYLFERGGRLRTTDIAAQFHVDPSTITKTIAELAETGLVRHEPYRGIFLTDKGKRHAGYLVKRHRILSLMLTHYGLTHEQACEEAARFESLVSKDTIDRICVAMGHPRLGVCGEITHDDGCLEQEY